MGLISSLFGTGDAAAPNSAKRRRAGDAPARSIGDVESALERLASERAAARADLAAGMQERERLLLVDGSETRIAAIDAASDAVRLTLERFDRAEPLLLAELQALRTEKKAKRWRELRASHDSAAAAHAKALRAALATLHAMAAISNQARSEGFEHETQAAFVPPARMLTPEAVEQFAAAIERAREMTRPAPSAPPPVVTREGLQAARAYRERNVPGLPTSAPVKAAPAPPAAKTKPRQLPPPPPQLAADADGNARVVAIRAGLELPDGAQARAGHVYAVPIAIAQAWLKAGAGEVAEPELAAVKEGAT